MTAENPRQLSSSSGLLTPGFPHLAEGLCPWCPRSRWPEWGRDEVAVSARPSGGTCYQTRFTKQVRVRVVVGVLLAK